ncbi:hypothetical protein [uncultured Psychrobacter sp.]|uniref:hypothetical protein n=1 Tax=uncultured Psychrobacter sp. TaxID=259303 RepID=UPI00345A3149
MSSYSFSHQFYQRWTQAPEPVRAAIVQELTDITTLLQTDTPFEEFVFSTHDLDAHLDDLYAAYQKQQAAAKEIADKQAALRIAAEKQQAEEKLAAEKEARAKAEAQRQEEKAQQEKETAAQKERDSISDTVAETTDAANIDSKADDDSKNQVDDSARATTDTADRASETTIVKPKKGAAIDLSLKDPVVNAAHEDLIHELEMHVDDYLSEQMMQISEDLKSWLRAEVSRQLNESAAKNKAADDNAKKS